MNTKVLQVKTSAQTKLVVRSSTGQKLFDIDLLGVTVSFAVPHDAEIKVEPRADVSNLEAK
jgi:hypothetical protein